MGFWDELKDLGRDIGQEFANLGQEIKQIGKETVDEFKEDPKKFLKESASEIAEGSVKLAKSGAKHGLRILEKTVSSAMFSQMKQLEGMYQAGEMPKENAAKHPQMRMKWLTDNLREVSKLTGVEVPTDWDSEKIEKHQAKIERAHERLKWCAGLPNLGLDSDVAEEVDVALRNAQKKTRSLEAMIRTRRNQEQIESKE